MERVEENFNEGVGIVALELVLTAFPAAVVADVWTAFGVVKELVGRAAEVLLAVGVVALAPVVDGRVADGAERRLVAVEHELVVAKHALQVFEVVSEAVLVHEGAHQRTPLGACT